MYNRRNFFQVVQKVVRLFSWLFLIQCLFPCIYGSSKFPEDFLPVVYVIYGIMPMYLRINVELASRNNHVVVISDHLNSSSSHIDHFGNHSNKVSSSKYRVFYEDLSLYSTSAQLFKPVYKHLSKDHNGNRQKHELRCFQRWFILRDFMIKNQIARTFFSDGDSSVFMNIRKAIEFREKCSAIVNVDSQVDNIYRCVYIFICVYIHTYIYVYTYIRLYICIHICIVYIYIYVYIYTSIYICIYV
jgi:hypothetical protein